MEKFGYKAVVSGTVQGVGFRYFTAKKAKQLNITGYAKNLSNGTVEVLMFGTELQLQNLLDWLGKGPQMSSVIDVKMTPIPFSEQVGFSCY
ncbi:acylphosphatase [Psychromonas sp. KJ10-10]|uniref:acylphosphatase n=1 Tax=Psychromonas sp. KJ10-10 TaxID=3391823 RepID=UPI0039B68AE3